LSLFEDGLAEEVRHSLNSPAARLLDAPAMPANDPLYFFEKTYTHDDIVSPALFRLRGELLNHQGDEVWLNEQLHDILRRLLQAQHQVRQEVDALPALRATTREELYRRLHRAKEFIARLVRSSNYAR
jgi:hypothetical protein